MTYGDIDKLSTPCDEIFFIGNMRIGHGIHVVQECGFGFVKVCSHDVENWSAIVGDGS
jgi:hypothetical protein